jgi:SulP family sulfate permease
MQRLLPFIQWLPELRRWQILRADVVAGITVALIFIPQAMAYAKLAGLPPVYGLYAAFLPPIIAALFGSSRHLSTGPVAMASLISAATIQTIVPPGSEAYITYSILLALMVGSIRLSLGLLRLGMLVSLLSAPVVVGFTNAAALIIATSQLHHVFGVSGEKGAYHYQTVWHVLERAATQPHWPTLGMAGLTAGLFLFGRYKLRQRPYVIGAVVIAILVSWLSNYQGAIVGEIPQGLPALKQPEIDWQVVPQLLTGALILTLIGLLETMSIAKSIATKSKQRIDVNQELIGQGLASLVGSFFQSFTVSGSFSRSAVNFASGGVTGFSLVISSMVVMLTLLFLTPLLYYLPQATLAVIIMFAVLNLIRIEPVLTAARVSRQDGLIGVLTFLLTLGLAPKLHLGIAVGIALSLVTYFYRSMRPHVAYLARYADGSLRDADANGLALDQRIAIIRFDGRLYFGNTSYFEDTVLEAISRISELRYLVIDAGGINQIDASGEQTVRQITERLRDVGIDVYFTRAKPQLISVLERTGCMDYIGADHFFTWNQHALEYLWDQMEPTYKARCPLNVPTPKKESGSWSI